MTLDAGQPVYILVVDVVRGSSVGSTHGYNAQARMRVSVLIPLTIPTAGAMGAELEVSTCPPALLALTRSLKEPVAVRNSSPRIHAGGKALLPVLTQLASEICLLQFAWQLL